MPEVQDTTGVAHFSALGPEPRVHPGLNSTTPTHPFPKSYIPLLFAVQENSLRITEQILEPRRREILRIFIIRNQDKLTAGEGDALGFSAFPYNTHRPLVAKSIHIRLGYRWDICHLSVLAPDTQHCTPSLCS